MGTLLNNINMLRVCFLLFITLRVLEALIKKYERISSLENVHNGIINEHFEDLIAEILIGEATVNDFIIHYDSTSCDFIERIIKQANAKKQMRIKPRELILIVNSSHPVTTVMLNYDQIEKSNDSFVKILRRFTMHIISLKEPLKFDEHYSNHLISSDILIFICQKQCGSCKGAFNKGASLNALDPLFLTSSKLLKRVLLTVIVELIDDRVRLYDICFYCGVASGELIQKYEFEIPTEVSFNNAVLYSELIDTFKFNNWNFKSHIFKVGFRYKEMHFGCGNPKETVTTNKDESVVLCEALYNLEGNILLEVQRRLNFTVEMLTFRADRSDGSAEKLISVTNENRVDWAVGGVTVTSPRTKMVYFSFPVSEDPAKIIYSSSAGFLEDGTCFFIIILIMSALATTYK